MFSLREDWYNALSEEMKKDYFQELLKKLTYEYANYTIYPPKEKVFSSMNHLPIKDVKVVIVGQDPYHEEGQAEGLAFSVPNGIEAPPSLRNIKKEISDEFGIKCSDCGSLHSWVKQGVLLLNSVLTVRKGQATSHKDYGWEIFTKKIIEILNASNKPIVFIAWGNYAKNVLQNVDKTKHLLLVSAHPSPLSAYNGFFGNNHFKKANEFLIKNGIEPIDWSC